MSIFLRSENRTLGKRSRLINATVFGGLFLMLVAYYGDWNGQILGVTQRDNNAVFLLVFSSLCLLALVARKKFLYLHLPYEGLLGIFVAIFILVGLLRTDLFSAVRQLLGVLCTLFIVYTLIALLHSLTFTDALFSISLVLFLTALASLYVHVSKVGPLTFLGNHYNGTLRLGGLFFFASFAMLLGSSGLFSLLGLFQKTSRLRKAFFAVNLLLISVLLLATDTRTAIVSFVLCAIYVLYFKIHRFTWRTVGALILLVLLASAFAVYYVIYLGSLDNEFALTMRTGIWEIAWQGILTRPFVGYGTENYFESSPYVGGFFERVRDPHSAVLSHALQYGVISAALFMLYYFLLLWRTFKYPKSERAVGAVGWFWLLAPFFWGYIYNISGGVVQVLCLLSLIGIMCHPDLIPVRRLRHE